MIKETYEVIENNNTYKVNVYDNGTVEKVLKSKPKLVEEELQEPTVTLEEQILQLQQDNLAIMDAIATMYEKLVLGGTV